MFRSMAVASALSASAVLAQHHHVDPFAGSGCNCTTFCDNQCAINVTKPENRTLYRMTPFGVLDLTNKNTADSPGDVSFVVSRRTAAYECKVDPSGYFCNSMVQFKGDDPNSTDLVLAMQVEVDGQWGPYLYCNDVNVTDPLGAWACTVNLNPPSVPGWPQSCKAAGFSPYEHVCFEGIPTKKKVVSGYGECCDLASSSNAHGYTLNTTSLECSVYYYPMRYADCTDGTSAVYDPPDSNECNCTRVHQTMGKENLTQSMSGHSSAYHVAGGLWFSHPEGGECKDGHYVGDGSGCTFRHVQTVSAVNASCVYSRIDAAIEANSPSCFSTCPPGNKTCDCYNRCYTESAESMTQQQLVQPFVHAMATSAGGCPQVDLSKVDAPAHQKPLILAQ